MRPARATLLAAIIVPASAGMPPPMRPVQIGWTVAPAAAAVTGDPLAPERPGDFRIFKVPSTVMAPTIFAGETIRVDLAAYRERAPGAGDIVVYRSRDRGSDHVHRVVGLPGDHVRMIRGALWINGRQAGRQKVGSYETSDYGPAETLDRELETLPGGAHYEILKRSDDGPLDDTPDYVVPDGALFVLGDNRDNSVDSRMMREIGFVPVANLYGRAVAIAGSPRPGRAGTALH